MRWARKEALCHCSCCMRSGARGGGSRIHRVACCACLVILVLARPLSLGYGGLLHLARLDHPLLDHLVALLHTAAAKRQQHERVKCCMRSTGRHRKACRRYDSVQFARQSHPSPLQVVAPTMKGLSTRGIPLRAAMS